MYSITLKGILMSDDDRIVDLTAITGGKKEPEVTPAATVMEEVASVVYRIRRRGLSPFGIGRTRTVQGAMITGTEYTIFVGPDMSVKYLIPNACIEEVTPIG